MDGSKAQNVPEQAISTNRSTFGMARILADELRLPLIEAEQSLAYARLEQDFGSLQTAQTIMQSSLRLVEQYIATGELLRRDQILSNNTITIGALLEEVAVRARHITEIHNVHLTLDYRMVKRPVLIDEEKVCTLLENLISAFVRIPAKHIVLGAHISRSGIRTGVFSDDLASSTLITQIRKLSGVVSQPTRFTTAGSAHLLIADWLGHKLALPITPARHAHNFGVAITIPWSKQLSLL